MNRSYSIDKIVIFLFALINLCSCMDDDLVSSTNQSKGNLFTLKIPAMNAIDIKTRAQNTKGIENMLAVVIRGGEANSEYISNASAFSGGEGSVSVELQRLNVQPDEDLYIFCNVNNRDLGKVTTAGQLFQTVTCTSGKDVMYGTREANASDNSILLSHSLSKVELLIAEGLEYSIDSLLVCDVPQTGYANGGGYLLDSGVEDLKYGSGMTPFFVSRLDNRGADTPTFLLAKLTGKGWYRLDFYANGKNLDSSTHYKDSLLDIEPNTYYHFSINSVKNEGYTSKVEARKNPGSNIVYGLSVDKSTSISNGQYSLTADKDVILLYPGESTISGTVDISAVFPDVSTGEVTTYLAKLHSVYKHLTFANPKDTVINLIKEGEILTTANSNRTLSFSCTGAWIENDYLEITLGNETKRIPFKIPTANSYLMDCSDGHSINIPYLQANLEVPPPSKAQRIEKGDVKSCEIIWADQPSSGLTLTPDDEKGWFTVRSSNPNFAGNVVVGAKDKDGTVLWSWHIWCMKPGDDNPIEYKKTKGIYDYIDNYEQQYSNFIWMDRNLGAYDLRPGKASSRGLGYCNGRKDPFTLGAEDLLPLSWEDKDSPAPVFPEATLYSKSNVPFTMCNEHPDYKQYGYTDFSAVPEVGGKKSKYLEFSIKYPFCLLTDPKVPGDWREEAGDYWLNNGQKSGYDPCPVGWRLPYVTEPLGPWYPFTFANRATGENVLDQNEEYGVSWKIGNGKYAYYPYAPYAMSLGRNGSGELVSQTRRLDESIEGAMVNKKINLVCADGMAKNTIEGVAAGHRIFALCNEPGGAGYAYGLIRWEACEAGKAVTTRCVRDKLIK